MISRALFTSTTDRHATPQRLFDELNAEFGFTLDVCALPENTKCNMYYTPQMDGLQQPWEWHTCWMNPPYGRDIGKWVMKAYLCKSVVVGLLPARTDTAWFHNFVLGKAEIRFIRGRLKFGDAKNSAPFPSIIAIWR